MNKLLVFFFLFLCFCSEKPSGNINGFWQPQSKFYSAKYHLTLENNELFGKVIYYDDGTTIYKSTGTDKDYFLKNMNYKNNEFSDNISGATSTQPNLLIRQIHNDTLLVVSKIMNSSLTEKWIRIKN